MVGSLSWINRSSKICGANFSPQMSLMKKSGEIVEDIFGDALATSETETEIELNFAVLKLKHKIKRKK